MMHNKRTLIIVVTLVVSLIVVGNIYPKEKQSMSNIIEQKRPVTESAYFAGGCFWGVEYYFENLSGVISVTSGYIGGNVDNPTYKQVSTGKTRHAETVRIVYDPERIPYEKLAKLFFEIHDPTQVNRQGPDVGSQYRSAIFYESDTQKKAVQILIDLLEKKGSSIATELSPVTSFWPAEEYHQNYYNNSGQAPTCHFRTKRFD